MNGLSPGQDDVLTIHGRGGGAERVVDRRAFLLGGRREREERKLGNSIDLEDNGRHCKNPPGVTEV
jgi:hypothetical protein